MSEDMAPYCFHPACSPHLAAAHEGVVIRAHVIGRAFDRLNRAHDAVVVEGAGGVLVPLNRHLTILDLMGMFELPVLLVARSGLGTLNHTLLSLQALRSAGVTVLGVVLNQVKPGYWGWIERDNRKVIEREGGVEIVASLRFGTAARPLQRAMEPIVRNLMRHP